MLETVKIVLDLDRRGIGFRSLTESFDTKTALGRGVLALLAAVAEDERDRLRERTRAGIQAARRNGKHVGRPSTLTPEKLDLALRLIAEGKGKAAAARMVGVHPATLRRALNGPDDLRGSPGTGKGFGLCADQAEGVTWILSRSQLKNTTLFLLRMTNSILSSPKLSAVAT